MFIKCWWDNQIDEWYTQQDTVYVKMYNAQNSTKYFEGTHKEGVKEQTYEQETTHTKFRNVVGCGSEGNVMELRRCLGYFNYIKRWGNYGKCYSSLNVDGEFIDIWEIAENGSLHCGFWSQTSWAQIIKALLLMKYGKLGNYFISLCLSLIIVKWREKKTKPNKNKTKKILVGLL